MNYCQKLSQQIWSWLRREWLVLVLALAVGLILAAPYFLAALALGQNYQGLPLLPQDSEGEYLGRIHELTEGYFAVASSVFYEYKDWPALVPPIGEWLYFLPTILGPSVVTVSLVYKWLLPALLFLLIYSLLLDLTRRLRFWSVIGALVVTVGFDLTSWPFLQQVLFGHIDNYLSIWTRPVNPITGMLGLALYLILSYRIFLGRNRRWWVPGLLFTLLIGYFFSFVYAGIFTLGLIVAELTSGHYRRAGYFLASLFLGAVGVLALIGPTVYDVLTNKIVGGLNDPRLQGLFYTHLPLINKTALLGLGLFMSLTLIIFWFTKAKWWQEKWWLFSLILLVTDQLVFNLQVILGWTIWPQHFTQYTNVSLLLVGVILLSQLSLFLKPRLSRGLGWLVIAVLVLLLVKTIPTYQESLPTLLDFQSYRPVLTWLNEKTINQPCVVLVVQDDEVNRLQLNRFIPAYTNCDVYHSYNIYQGVPRQRVWHNLLVWLWFKGLTEQDLTQFLTDQNFWIRAYVFRDWRDMFCCSGDPWIAHLAPVTEWQTWYQGVSQKVVADYSHFLNQDPKLSLSQYRLDYVIVDKTSRVRTDLKLYPWLVLVYRDERYSIYRFVK